MIGYDEPILFIEITSAENNSRQEFRITEEAQDFFRNLSDKKVMVVGIAGPQRTGKSFLANTLLNRMDGFKIGNTTLPCTKGIWIWGKPIINGDKATVILDTEGLHSICKTKRNFLIFSSRSASGCSHFRDFSFDFFSLRL